MDFQQFLNSYFTLTLISKLIERSNPVRSLVFDLVFGYRTNTPSARVRVDDIMRRIGNVPVVARGSAALSMGGYSGNRTEIEPMPIRLSDFVTGADVNDLRSLYGAGDERGQSLVAAYLDKKVIDLMRTTEMTRNALCAQAITGKIDYMMQTEGGYERYQVVYGDGNTLTFSPSTKWNDPDCPLTQIAQDLSDIEDKMRDEGFSGEVAFLVGKKAFSAISTKLAAMTNETRVDGKVEKGTIFLMGYKLVKDSITYKDRDASGNEVVKYEVDPNKIVAYVVDVPELTYCAVDDVDGNLEATPFFSKVVKTDDPSGYRVISESKPMPLVAAKGFCWATVYDSTISPVGGMTVRAENVTVEAPVERTYTQSNLEALTKTQILAIATERGYEMTTDGDDLKADIITDFLALQTAAQS
jgi:hypothetical protein